MKLDGWRTQQTETGSGGGGLTQWLPARSILLSSSEALCVWRDCLCWIRSVVSSSVTVCRLSPAPLHLYWTGVGRSDITAFIFASPPPLYWAHLRSQNTIKQLNIVQDMTCWPNVSTPVTCSNVQRYKNLIPHDRLGDLYIQQQTNGSHSLSF